MPSQIALIICLIYIFLLLKIDIKESENVSNFIWLPVIWMFISGSRYISHWLNLTSSINYSMDVMEGSPIDRIVFFLMILMGMFILLNRKVSWGRLISQNICIFLFLIYGLISITWSDYPYVSFKRWFKSFGSLIMALIILTEVNPGNATSIVLRRLSILTIPLSVLFIKYYPFLGRMYHRWSDLPIYTGISAYKNGLGQLCLLSGIYLCFGFCYNRQKDYIVRSPLGLILLMMVIWLFYKANSATSLGCMIICLFVLFSSRLSVFTENPKMISVFGFVIFLSLIVLELLVNISGFFIEAMGRDSTLTTRVPMWKELVGMNIHPIVGFGYENFWVGNRIEMIQKNYGEFIHQAHNGYIETYLNLGLIGLILLLLSLLSGILKIVKNLSFNYYQTIFLLCFLITALFYNWTEASFLGTSNIWLITLLGVIDIPDYQNNILREREF